MTETNNSSPSLQSRFEEFQTLHPDRESKGRKQQVRKLQGEVKKGEVTIDSNKVQQYLEGDFELARILVYLLMENGKINVDQAMLRDIIINEWERLRWNNLNSEISRMPLYYAVRMYLARIKAVPEIKATVYSDLLLIREIKLHLAKSSVDRNSQLYDRTTELLSLMESGDYSFSSPTIVAARISRRGAVIGAVIAAIAAIVVGLMANWDKISSQGSQPVAPATPKTKQ